MHSICDFLKFVGSGSYLLASVQNMPLHISCFGFPVRAITQTGGSFQLRHVPWPFELWAEGKDNQETVSGIFVLYRSTDVSLCKGYCHEVDLGRLLVMNKQGQRYDSKDWMGLW